MSHWVRLWEDMPTDPKWRVIARRSGRPMSEVLSVFCFMLVNAGGSRERGTLDGWNDEDVAAALDAEPEHIAAIREAMQGKTLEGERLTGWERRQPKREREDDSAARVQAFRDRKNHVTPCNATKRPDKIREDTEKKEEDSPKRVRTPYPEDFEKFWDACSAWRGHSGKKEALDAWRKLSPEDRQAAMAGVPGYSASLRVPNAPTPLHVCRFLKYRRFEVYAGANVVPFGASSDPPPRKQLTEAEMRQRAIEFARREQAGGNQ